MRSRPELSASFRSTRARSKTSRAAWASADSALAARPTVQPAALEGEGQGRADVLLVVHDEDAEHRPPLCPSAGPGRERRSRKADNGKWPTRPDRPKEVPMNAIFTRRAVLLLALAAPAAWPQSPRPGAGGCGGDDHRRRRRRPRPLHHPRPQGREPERDGRTAGRLLAPVQLVRELAGPGRQDARAHAGRWR